MADLISFIGDVFGMALGQLGTVSINLGLITSGVLVISIALGVFRRLRGRG